MSYIPLQLLLVKNKNKIYSFLKYREDAQNVCPISFNYLREAFPHICLFW